MVDVAYKPVEKVGNIYAGGTLTPPKFMPSYYEWLSAKGTQITHDLASGSYTVPDDMTLFLTNISLSYLATTNTGISYVRTSEFGGGFIIVACKGGSDVASSIVTNYSIPLKIRSGCDISLELSQAGTNQSIFVGFLVENADIPAF